MTKYAVIPRVKKKFMRNKYYVQYDVVYYEMVWYDPSYGNGAGCFTRRAVVWCTFDTKSDAEVLAWALNYTED